MSPTCRIPIVAFFCVTAGAAAAADPGRVPDPLTRRAQERGEVRVIVELDLDARPEGDLRGRAEVARQRGRIAAAREALTGSLPAGSFVAGHPFETIPFVAMQASVEALRALETMPGVRSVEEDRLFAPLLAQSGPIVEADNAWSAGFTGAGWAVAILDTGVDKRHSFLAGKVVSEACYSSGSSCPNGNKTQTTSGAGVPCSYAPSSCRHGTHVAGIAAGTGSSFSGVAKGASIIAIQVFSRYRGSDCDGAPEDPCAFTSSSDIVAGLERVLHLSGTIPTAAVNLSVGGDVYTTQAQCDSENPALRAAIENLRSAGIATIVASGNDGFINRISVPACLSTAVSVGATTKADNVTTFSNSASFLSLLAPGQSITSSVSGGGFDSFSGTSMAAPHVTGAWAIRRQSHPLATVAGILSDLRAGGVPITDPRNGVTTPRVDIGDALVTCDAAASATSGDPPLALDFTATGGLGSPPFSYSWDFDDGTPLAVAATTSHTFDFPGTYRVALRGQDDGGISCSDIVTVQVHGPSIASVRTAGSPFRLIVTGDGFEPGAIVEIDGQPAPATVYKSPTRLVAMKGTPLRAMVPRGATVSITVVNPGGAVSAPFALTR